MNAGAATSQTEPGNGGASTGNSGHPLKGVGFPEVDPEVTCPSCGRFAGTYERCPYCGAGMKVRLSVRILRRVALAVSILGLVILWLAARSLEVPRMDVGDLTETHAFAIIRLQGKLTAEPSFGDRGDSLWFSIDDGTGRANIRGYGPVAEHVKEMNLGRDDRIEVQGSIRIQPGRPPSLSLPVGRNLKILERAAKPEPRKPVAISSLDLESGRRGDRVRIEGRVARAWSNSGGQGATLEDATGQLAVWVFKSDVLRLGAAAGHLAKEGARVRVDGRLSVFENKRGGKESLQLKPFGSPDSVVLLEAAPVRSGTTTPTPTTPPAEKSLPVTTSAVDSGTSG